MVIKINQNMVYALCVEFFFSGKILYLHFLQILNNGMGQAVESLPHVTSYYRRSQGISSHGTVLKLLQSDVGKHWYNNVPLFPPQYSQ